MIYTFIAAEKANFPVTFMFEHFGVPSSSYYEWINGAKARDKKRRDDLALVEQIEKIHESSDDTYGERRVTPALHQQGIAVNHKRVERLMREHKIAGHAPKRRVGLTKQLAGAKAPTDLVKRDFVKHDVDIAWCGDISYIRTWEGWLYLATVIDLGSRRVIGYAMAEHMRTELVENALKMAVNTRGVSRMPNVIFHSDKGGQYTGDDFAKAAESLGVVRSTGAVATCFDNAVAESFFATLKKELIYRVVFLTRKAARQTIFEWIEGW